ncbi:MAG TPA: phage baseplate assembly protein V [Blastocatellia bacterium]|nr:phage baseplate assembly protein V [Blastocatellia bacterium]
MPNPTLESMPETDAAGGTQRFFGKYRGVVTDNQDPLNLGRVQARVPEILQDEPTGWAYPAAPYAGDNQGLFTIPPIDAGVWIEFEAGDVSRPIWAGTWWSENQVPKDNGGAGATPPLKILRSEEGLMLALDDDAQTVTISDANGTNLVVVKVQEGQVRIEATSKVVIEAPQIELTDGAGHPLVFGDDLLIYLNQLVNIFNAHLHVGELAAGVFPVTPAPPVPPFPPAQPPLLSTRVKTG